MDWKKVETNIPHVLYITFGQNRGHLKATTFKKNNKKSITSEAKGRKCKKLS